MLNSKLTHPELLRLLGQSGHKDRIAIVDSNYPAFRYRNSSVPFLSFNITHDLVKTSTVIELIGQSFPIEKITYPLPQSEKDSGNERAIHSEFTRVRNENFPDAEIETVIPTDFYELTSEIGLVVMIGTGERSHYGSVLLTLGYLPELH